MLDNIKIRKLENGYTVKYHIELPESEPNAPKGYSKELYVADRVNLESVIKQLINQHIGD